MEEQDDERDALVGDDVAGHRQRGAGPALRHRRRRASPAPASRSASALGVLGVGVLIALGTLCAGSRARPRRPRQAVRRSSGPTSPGYHLAGRRPDRTRGSVASCADWPRPGHGRSWRYGLEQRWSSARCGSPWSCLAGPWRSRPSPSPSTPRFIPDGPAIQWGDLDPRGIGGRIAAGVLGVGLLFLAACTRTRDRRRRRRAGPGAARTLRVGGPARPGEHPSRDPRGRRRRRRRGAAPDRARPARRRPAPARIPRDEHRARPAPARHRPRRRGLPPRDRARRGQARHRRAAQRHPGRTPRGPHRTRARPRTLRAGGALAGPGHGRRRPLARRRLGRRQPSRPSPTSSSPRH